jgi:hypothetical protein
MKRATIHEAQNYKREHRPFEFPVDVEEKVERGKRTGKVMPTHVPNGFDFLKKNDFSELMPKDNFGLYSSASESISSSSEEEYESESSSSGIIESINKSDSKNESNQKKTKSKTNSRVIENNINKSNVERKKVKDSKNSSKIQNNIVQPDRIKNTSVKAESPKNPHKSKTTSQINNEMREYEKKIFKNSPSLFSSDLNSSGKNKRVENSPSIHLISDKKKNIIRDDSSSSSKKDERKSPSPEKVGENFKSPSKKEEREYNIDDGINDLDLSFRPIVSKITFELIIAK